MFATLDASSSPRGSEKIKITSGSDGTQHFVSEPGGVPGPRIGAQLVQCFRLHRTTFSHKLPKAPAKGSPQRVFANFNCPTMIVIIIILLLLLVVVVVVIYRCADAFAKRIYLNPCVQVFGYRYFRYR